MPNFDYLENQFEHNRTAPDRTLRQAAAEAYSQQSVFASRPTASDAMTGYHLPVLTIGSTAHHDDCCCCHDERPPAHRPPVDRPPNDHPPTDRPPVEHPPTDGQHATPTEGVKGLYVQVFPKKDGTFDLDKVREFLKNPEVSGVTLGYHWKQLEPEKGQYDTQNLKDVLNVANQEGKGVNITIHSGAGTPDWLYKEGAQKVDFAAFNSGEKVQGDHLSMPPPWDPVYQKEMKNFATTLGKQIGDNPALKGVELPLGGAWAESTIPAEVIAKGEKQFGSRDAVAQKIQQGWEGVTDSFTSAFKTQDITMNIAGPMRDNGGRWSPAETSIVTNLIQHGENLVGDRLNIKYNGLSPDRLNPNVMSIFDKFKGTGIDQEMEFRGSSVNNPMLRIDHTQPLEPQFYDMLKKAMAAGTGEIEVFEPLFKDPRLADVWKWLAQQEG